jgi:hypothetical protein
MNFLDYSIRFNIFNSIKTRNRNLIDKANGQISQHKIKVFDS